MNFKKEKAEMIRFFVALSVAAFFALPTNAQTDRSDRPSYFPTPPETPNSLFFIQRNRNTNTIVYDAKTGPNGDFDRSKPIDVYWLRYASTGHRKEISWLERTFAYGYSAKKNKTGEGFLIQLSAYDGRKITLKKTPEGRPIATIICNGKECRLDCLYVFADESGTWPDVIHVDIHATDLKTGKKEKERITN